MAEKRGRQSKKLSKNITVESLEDDELFLTELELMKLSVHEQRVEMNKIQGEKFAMQEQLLNIEYMKSRDLLRKRQGECVLGVEKARNDYNAVREQVQVRLGVNLEGYTVNEAGQLTAIPQSDN